MALETKSTNNIVTYSKHSTQCKNNLNAKFNKKKGLFIRCNECDQFVLKINTKPTTVQEYRDFTSEVGKFRCKENISLEMKFNEMMKILNGLFNTNFANKTNKKWFAIVYDHFYQNYYKHMHENEDLKWMMSHWKEDQLNWCKFPNWDNMNLTNYRNLQQTQKNVIENYVLAVDQIVREGAFPYPLHLLGFSVVLSQGSNSQAGGQDTTRHYDELYHGNPFVITAKGNYTATPGHVSNQLHIKQGGAYFYPHWKWHDTKHGYRNNHNPCYKIVLKYMNKEIVNGIFNNIGLKSDHEWLDIDQQNRTFKYNAYVSYFGASDEEEKEDEDGGIEDERKSKLKEFRRDNMNRNRNKRKRKRKFSHKKRRKSGKKKTMTNDEQQNTVSDHDNDSPTLFPLKKKRRCNQ